MRKFSQVLVIVLCTIVLIMGSISATVAYLTMKTQSVENTFTAGNIFIELKQETELDTSKMVPGMEYTVDPEVTVKENSEACWLFIKIEKTTDFDRFLTYTVAEGWVELESGVYYREVAATTTDESFPVIKDNTITAVAERTKDDYNALSGAQFNLNVTAYAVQSVGFEDANSAWTAAKALDNTQN